MIALQLRDVHPQASGQRPSCTTAVPELGNLKHHAFRQPLPLTLSSHCSPQHYCLATNVIGSEARGTMRRAVQALKAGYETPVFPLLDACRVALGARLDAEFAHRKGRIMQGILARAAAGQAGAASGPPWTAAAAQPAKQHAGQAGGQAAAAPAGSGCPFAHAAARPPATGDTAALGAAAADGITGFEAARHKLYSWEGVPPAWRAEVAAEVAQQAKQLSLLARPADGAPPGAELAKPLAFLDHAWGQLAPAAQVRPCACSCCALC